MFLLQFVFPKHFFKLLFVFLELDRNTVHVFYFLTKINSVVKADTFCFEYTFWDKMQGNHQIFEISLKTSHLANNRGMKIKNRFK